MGVPHLLQRHANKLTYCKLNKNLNLSHQTYHIISPSSSHHRPWFILAKTDIPKTFYQAT